MNKQELLQEVEDKSLRIIKVVKQDDPEKETKNVNSYIVNVMEETGLSKSTGRNIGFYVFDEGTVDEKAVYRDEITELSLVAKLANDYVATLTEYIKVYVTSVDEKSQFAIAKTITDIAGIATEGEIVVYHDGSKITHKEYKRM